MSPASGYQFASDNTAAVCPEVWAALAAANRESCPSYGDDRWTRRASDRVREVFETECEVFFVFNGTAANSLALAQLARPFQSIICHEHAHIETDECGAPEFFSGGSKLLPTRGKRGKLDLAEIGATLLSQPELHAPKPSVISITQSTELGTVYTRDEIGALCEFARKRSFFVHMDGARFANAIAALGCAPKEITWKPGVDVLCFGGTKNGTAAGDLVVFFNRELAREFDYRVKQGGQLASKLRFLAAPWVALLTDDLWLRNARHANECAKSLAQKLQNVSALRTAFPREASALFLHMPETLVRQLHSHGWHFYKFIEPDIYRLMCSWATTESHIEAFVADVKALNC